MIERRTQTLRRTLGASLVLAAWLASGTSPAGAVLPKDLEPLAPAAFLPGGMLDMQLGSSWTLSKKAPTLSHLTCQQVAGSAEVFDEVCFFKTVASARVGGAEIHDGFMVRKGDEVVLIGTGIAIKNADDPLAEAVMQSFQSQVHAAYQHTGDDVLFVELPNKRMSPEELAGFSQRAPVLLVQLESKGSELAVLYGYLAPVNAFSAMAAQ